MALIVEDGTLVNGCNSYVTLEEADAYLTVRALWGADDDAKKETALIRAFDALNTLDWKGEPASLWRVTAFPRKGIADLPADTVPYAVKQAQMELAALIYGGEHNPLAPVERGGKYTSKSDSETVDVLSESHSVTYAADAPVETYLPAVYGILKAYLNRVPGQSGLASGRVGKA